MKLVLFIVSLSAIAQLFSGIKADYLRCFKSILPDSKEYLEIANLAVPKSRAGKCLYECMLRSAGLVQQDGLVNIDIFIDKLKALKYIETRPLTDHSLEVIKDLLGKCKRHKHLSGDVCETTALFLDCAVQESKARRWEPTQIIRIIRAPYYADASFMMRQALRVG